MSEIYRRIYLREVIKLLLEKKCKRKDIFVQASNGELYSFDDWTLEEYRNNKLFIQETTGKDI